MTKSDRPNPLAWLQGELAALEQAGLLRTATGREGPQGVVVRCGGQELVNFSSNDYLGLAADERLSRAVREATAAYGWGSGASPLISGHSELHRRLEQALADFEGAEAALLFPSGFAANLGTIAALVGQGDVVFTDRKNHASLLDGCRLSRADVRVYPHNDCRRLGELLAKAEGYRRRLIVTDGLFSMDGDLAPLGELADLADRYSAMLLVDEAHATGVFGVEGRGVAEHLGVKAHVHVGTLSKALGGVGGFVCGTRALVEWLRNRARPYVFSTGAPTACAAASLAALEIVRSEPQRRRRLLAQAATLRNRLIGQGWTLGPSASQILPIILGEPNRAWQLAQELRARGFWVPAIRPPTVPEGESCLRISLAWGHSETMIDRLLEALGPLAAGRRLAIGPALL